jgi:YtkA-like
MSHKSLPALLFAVLALSACMTPPADLNLSLQQPTAQGRYRVHLQPPEKTPAINQMHAWQVQVTAPDGRVVRDARIAVDGGMPQHGHGLPTRPQVTQEVSTGTYRMEGMKFSMTGWWEIKLAIQAAEGADAAVFNTIVDTPGVKR